jgi:heat shock protein HslJ
MKMCSDPTGVMDQEAQYLAALQSAATYRIETNVLELRTQDDALAASLSEKR